MRFIEVLSVSCLHENCIQVHRAVLPNGEQVVVKVQRPGLKKLFDIDLGEKLLVKAFFIWVFGV